MRKWLGMAALALPLSLAASASVSPVRSGTAIALPPTMVWAWERAEDLRWLPADVGVAYVASTIELESGRVRERPRAYPLLVRDDTPTVPVVHVDASWRRPPVLDAAQRNAIVNAVRKAAAHSASHAVQLDFEVRRSQRPFLLDVVAAIRGALPDDISLSVTALASWCAGDYWIGELAADEIVPMAFRMSQDDARIRSLLAEHGGFPRNRCRAAIGIAADEPVTASGTRRRYLFSPVSWTPQQWQRLQQHLH